MKKYKVYASVYKMPETGMIKMHSIVVVDSRGRLVDDAPGPANIAPLVGRLTKKLARSTVKEWVKENMNVTVKVEDVILKPPKALNKILFRLENA